MSYNFEQPFAYAGGRAGGFGFDDSDGPLYDGTANTAVIDDGSGVYYPTDSNGDGGSNPGWFDIYGGPLLKTISNIFAPVQTSVAQAQAGAYHPAIAQSSGVYPVYNSQGVLTGYSNTPAGSVVNAGQGILQNVGNLFGVNGSTVLLVGGVLVLFLFMKPPSRR